MRKFDVQTLAKFENSMRQLETILNFEIFMLMLLNIPFLYIPNRLRIQYVQVFLGNRLMQ